MVHEPMADEETHIRALIERWARAVHAGDMGGVLAHEHHSFPTHGA